jgi:elongation factor G|tara:strand:+ start:371 stop:604 length:234 start_codon:yes stop_codon:yes gene_type:complete
VGDALSDLTVNRRGQILDVLRSDLGEGGDEAEGGGHDMSVIMANVPLATMLGYATSIRSITQGEGNFSMEFLEYQKP